VRLGKERAGRIGRRHVWLRKCSFQHISESLRNGHGAVDRPRADTAASRLTQKAIKTSAAKAKRTRTAAPFYLERIFAATVDDAIERRRKGGKGRGTMSSNVNGFLREMSAHICGQEDELPPVS
jgi:hypothetical protein